MEFNKIFTENCLIGMKKLPDQSVNCCVTSPPYYGLRDYGTAKWEGGDEDCDHRTFDNDIENAGEKQKTNVGSNRTFRDVCKRCGAIRNDEQIGMEETPEHYVQTMVNVFRDVKRVLRDVFGLGEVAFVRWLVCRKAILPSPCYWMARLIKNKI